MIKNKGAIVLEKNNRKYELIFETDSPAGDLHDILMEMRGCIIEKMLQCKKEDEEVFSKNINFEN